MQQQTIPSPQPGGRGPPPNSNGVSSFAAAQVLACTVGSLPGVATSSTASTCVTLIATRHPVMQRPLSVIHWLRCVGWTFTFMDPRSPFLQVLKNKTTQFLCDQDAGPGASPELFPNRSGRRRRPFRLLRDNTLGRGRPQKAKRGQAGRDQRPVGHIPDQTARRTQSGERFFPLITPPRHVRSRSTPRAVATPWSASEARQATQSPSPWQGQRNPNLPAAMRPLPPVRSMDVGRTLGSAKVRRFRPTDRFVRT